LNLLHQYTFHVANNAELIGLVYTMLFLPYTNFFLHNNIAFSGNLCIKSSYYKLLFLQTLQGLLPFSYIIFLVQPNASDYGFRLNVGTI